MTNYADDIEIDDIDTFFFWESKADYQPNQCRIRIYWITWEKAIIIATDVTDNPGRKVANVTKEIMSFANHIYGLAPNKTTPIEHYSNSELDEDLYLQVLLTNNEAMRYEIGWSRLKQLVGKPM